MNKTYDDGVQEGEMRLLAQMHQDLKGRVDNHSTRLRTLERVVWVVGGFAAFLEFWPRLSSMLGGGS